MLSQAWKQYQSNLDSLACQTNNAQSQVFSHLLQMCRGYGNHSIIVSKVVNWLNDHHLAEEDLINYICDCIERDAVQKAGYYTSARDESVRMFQQQIKQNVQSVITSLKNQYQALLRNSAYQLSQSREQLAKELIDLCKDKGDRNTIQRLVYEWLDTYILQ